MATHNLRSLRTYSRRILKDSHEPPAKRQRLEVSKDLEDEPPPTAAAVPSAARVKISHYFKPTLSSSPSSIASSVYSSDRPQERNPSPPSSPPSREQTPPRAQPKRPKKRRLTTKPVLQPTSKMTDYTSAASERRRGQRMTAIEGGLMANADPAIVGPASLAEKAIDLTKTHTKIAREDAFPKGMFNRRRQRRENTPHRTFEIGWDSEDDESSEDPDSEPESTLDESTGNPGAIDIPGAVDPAVAGESSNQNDTPGVPKNPLGHYIDGKLVQTQLDLGAAQMVVCPVCGTNYNKTDQQDIKYHDERHAAFIDGVPIKGLRVVGNACVRKVHSIIHDNGTEDFIVVIDRYSHRNWRALAMDVLEEHVDVALGCKPMNDDYLWMTIPDPELRVEPDEMTYMGPNRLLACNTNIPHVTRFQVYLYVKRARVVAALLVERIKKGRELVLEQIANDDFGAFPAVVPQTIQQVTCNEHEAFLGINKIWTLPKYRRRGLATDLLFSVRENAIPGRRVDVTQIAWTYTTEMGSLLAKNYNLGRASYAWLSYTEEPDRFLF